MHFLSLRSQLRSIRFAELMLMVVMGGFAGVREAGGVRRRRPDEETELPPRPLHVSGCWPQVAGPHNALHL